MNMEWKKELLFFFGMGLQDCVLFLFWNEQWEYGLLYNVFFLIIYIGFIYLYNWRYLLKSSLINSFMLSNMYIQKKNTVPPFSI